VRIGELSAELEKGKAAGRGRGKELPTGGKFKAQALKAAGPNSRKAAANGAGASHAVAI
jgi:hypothetical protein